MSKEAEEKPKNKYAVPLTPYAPGGDLGAGMNEKKSFEEISETQNLINHLDAILARLESAIHGHYGDELTEARGILRKIETHFSSQQEIPKVEFEKNQLVEIKINDERGRALVHGTFALKEMWLKPIIHSGRQEKKEQKLIFINHY